MWLSKTNISFQAKQYQMATVGVDCSSLQASWTKLTGLAWMLAVTWPCTTFTKRTG